MSLFSALFLMAGILFAGVAEAAYPAVGNIARYITDDSLMGTYEQESEIFKYEPITATEGRFRIRQTHFLSHGEDVTVAVQNSSQMLSTEIVARYLTYCAGMNGVLQTITVPAGTFKTCRITITGESYINEVYIADVPFGWAKMEFNSTNGSGGFTTVLKNYVH